MWGVGGNGETTRGFGRGARQCRFLRGADCLQHALHAPRCTYNLVNLDIIKKNNRVHYFMGKKKFIDKKRSVTYSLVYNSKEGEDDQGNDGAEREHDGWGDGGAPNWEHPVLSETRRRELLDLGFPDDGYDYLAHLRTIGTAAPVKLQGPEEGVAQAQDGVSQGREEQEVEPRGPFVFLPAPKVVHPQEDVALFDAAALTVQELVEEDNEEERGAQASAAIGAFARRRDPEEVAANRARIQEMEELMAAMNDMEVNHDESDDDESDDDENPSKGEIAGEGDLLDDFVVTASKGVPVGTVTEASNQDLDEYSDESEWDGSCDEDQELGRPPQRSIASTYWRPERSDRKGLLGEIDDQFERLVLEEYEDEDIGDMEENSQRIAGRATIGQFAGLIEEAHELNPSSTKSQLKKYMEACGFNDDDAELSIRAAKLAIQKFERLEESEHVGHDENPVLDVDEGRPRMEWDCESILSLRSNLYNHPRTIAEPRQRRICLKRNGLPMIMDEDDQIEEDQMEKKGDENYSDESENSMRAKQVASVPRPKNETTEEKKARKAAVKAAKKENRAAKKASKLAYRRETVVAAQRSANASVQASIVLN